MIAEFLSLVQNSSENIANPASGSSVNCDELSILLQKTVGMVRRGKIQNDIL